MQSSPFIRVAGLSRSFGDLRVLTDVTFTVHGGSRAGLIGQNGSGKSTLLRIMAGQDRPDSGTVEVSGGARVGLLWQDFPLAPESSVDEATRAAQRDLFAIRTAVERAGEALAAHPGDEALAATFEDALADAERSEVWSLEAIRDETLAGLGLGEVGGQRPVGTLSGGQRSRLCVACLLLSRPDILLLDEPTNHMDDSAAEFLQRTLVGWRGPVIAASHDRAFLDAIATEILDLDPVPGGLGEDGLSGVTRTRGRYSDHVLARLDEREAWESQYAAEQAEMRRLRGKARRDHQVGHAGRAPRTEGGMAKKFYGDRNARVVKRRVDDAERRLDTLEGSQVRRPPRDLVFAGLDAAGAPRSKGGQGNQVGIHLRGAGVLGRLAPVTLDLGEGQKILVVGANGSGKSTLLSMLAGRLRPTEGTVAVEGRLGLLTQDPVPADPSRTAAEAYLAAVGPAVAEAMPLASFGLLHPRDANRPVGVLSTGQLRRLDLAIVLANPPSILALDEPTNHLSLDLSTALEALLPDYPGTVVVASHDRWLRQRWEGPILRLEPVPNRQPPPDAR